MRWAITIAVLVTLCVLDFTLPAFESGPADTTRFELGVCLAIFSVTTLIAWIVWGRRRAIVLLAMAASIWLFLADVVIESVLRGDARIWLNVYSVILLAVTILCAAAPTAVGLRIWRSASSST